MGNTLPAMRTLLIPVLWYVSVWFAWEVAWSVGLVPRMPGPAVAMTAAIAMSLLAWRSVRSGVNVAREYPGTPLPGPSAGG